MSDKIIENNQGMILERLIDVMQDYTGESICKKLVYNNAPDWL